MTAMDITLNENKKFEILESYVKDYNDNIEEEQILFTISKSEHKSSLLYAITDKRIIEIKRLYYTDFDSWCTNSIKRTHIKKILFKKHFFNKLYDVIFIPDNNNFSKISFNNIDNKNIIQIKEIIK